ncbi:MAG TPA: TauD/TfdA family dioxygenase [Pyrinomonadaceae bacterium]|nr:TauD/TfdA family dioxygenase [Pyrinomonadaceae bacterium]
MSLEKAEPASLSSFRNVKRRAVSLTSESLVKMSHLTADSTFPLVIEPVLDQMNLVAWANSEREKLEALLLKHGAILFRNFRIASVGQFEQFARAISPDLLDYLERAAPRTEVGKNVYTSTEYPADQRIPLHHEMSYSHNWPTKIWFHCVEAAAQGGATPIAEDRKVFQRLDPKIKEIFMRKKVMYTRNYGEGVDLSWQDVFQTEDRSRVEEYCRQAKTEFEWKDHNRLKTRQIRQAVAVHPKTGEMVWFNHAHMFHISNVEPAVREALLSEFKEEDLPRNAYYGDGTKIEDSILDEIRGVYDELAVSFRWQEGDIMMLDNFLASHGREPFVGPRRILVALAELYTNPDFR